MHLKLSSAKCRSLWFGLNVLTLFLTKWQYHDYVLCQRGFSIIHPQTKEGIPEIGSNCNAIIYIHFRRCLVLLFTTIPCLSYMSVNRLSSCFNPPSYLSVSPYYVCGCYLWSVDVGGVYLLYVWPAIVSNMERGQGLTNMYVLVACRPGRKSRDKIPRSA